MTNKMFTFKCGKCSVPREYYEGRNPRSSCRLSCRVHGKIKNGFCIDCGQNYSNTANCSHKFCIALPCGFNVDPHWNFTRTNKDPSGNIKVVDQILEK